MSQAETLTRIFDRLNQIESYLCPVEVFYNVRVCRETPDFTAPEGDQFSEIRPFRTFVPRCMIDYLAIITEIAGKTETECGLRLEQPSVEIAGFNGDLLTFEGMVNLDTGDSIPSPSPSPSP